MASYLRSRELEHARRDVDGEYLAGLQTPHSREGSGASTRRDIDDQRWCAGPPDARDKLISHGSIENHGGVAHERNATAAWSNVAVS